MITEAEIKSRRKEFEMMLGNPCYNEKLSHIFVDMQLRLHALEQKEEKSFSNWFEKEGVMLYRGQANIIEAMRAAWNAARGK